MCGIAGIVKFKDSGIDLVDHIQKMNDTIRHRGPDGEGYLAITDSEELALYGKDTSQEIVSSSILHKPQKPLRDANNAHAILAHRRLKIIDITPTGHQPMCNADKNFWIVFNGEIYNYIELREQLKTEGYKFHTASDTEVILAAYSKWGYECVNHFNGMWAFTIYDKQKNVLFASRDRFGVKPFYYCINNNHFAFASEQKALLAGKIVDFVPNEKAIFDYWVFSEMEQEEEGMFKGIYELFPSHSLTLNLQTQELKKWKYYTLPYSKEFEGSAAADVTDKVAEYIKQAIKIRLRSDVEVGSCLSGGLDSSSIVSIAHNLSGKTINTFTTAFRDPKIDESNWAKIVADQTHSNEHYTYPESGELIKDLHNLIYCQDIPIWSTSTYAQYRVMQLIKEAGIKVVLDGQGGDELFAGYDDYYFYHFKDLALNKGSFSAEAKATGRAGELRKRYMSQLFLKKYMPGLPLLVQWKLRLRAHPELQYLNKGFVERNKARLKKEKEDLSLNSALNRDFNNTLLKSYLKCEDRCSMWHSVESRTPYSDDINLIEYVFSLPSSIKIKDGRLKSLMRDALRGTVPDAIIDRKDKKGYLTPNRKWIAEIRNEVRDVFENIAVSEYLDTKKILKDYELLFNQPNALDNGRIFKLMVFPMWLKVFSKEY